MIQVTKPFIPDLDLLNKYLGYAHQGAWLTNNGPLVRELTDRLQDYLGVKNLILTANGTLALQVAYKALGLTGNVLTSPFTFVATASAMKWQGITPQFCDIEPDTLGLSPAAVREFATQRTTALVPVHVYGNPCDVEIFDNISKEKEIPIVYDASHAFSINFKGQSVLNWGDASTLSFHATKLFHTVEGGGIVFKDSEVFERAKRMLNFGLGDPMGDISVPGINAKMSEVHAAYGLSVLESIDYILEKRSEVLFTYHKHLREVVEMPKWRVGATQNAAYAPIIMETEKQCINVLSSLQNVDVIARRYFYPCLNKLTEYKDNEYDRCATATNVAERIICLPLYPDLSRPDIFKIIGAVKRGCQQ
ncbi:dTDP-4-amino-4,6-dideoxygalactose transaminase [Franzmannia pantelleriensis]|uniref:dTDP-4-amino-4,6-dideoxygalactose transaminase n=1 Tax=Franzmannia pantelleriensis TaxID=48727 RepID=A0A1G9ERN1_9GAMM|nr:DegT/DnrJ/EryC1/StrS family aminotransferase [Halomonas pantelleriensis]SDK78738.1 dTDP-4-amino-4,6-dideoxygalactose transaminase [Halomonas pantelleriensis]